jgi:hypothetical protein
LKIRKSHPMGWLFFAQGSGLRAWGAGQIAFRNGKNCSELYALSSEQFEKNILTFVT